MEMQLFILGHVILYPICMIVATTTTLVSNPPNPGEDKTIPTGIALTGAFLLIPLEIVYWALHFIFV